MRCPSPPPPTTQLDRALARLGRDLRAIRMDPALPGRVEAAIRRRIATRDPGAATCVPRCVAVVGALLLAFFTGGGPGRRAASHRRAGTLGTLAAAQAGPIEARRLLEDARAQAKAPWPKRLEAFRRVLAATHPTDRSFARALEGAAAALRRAAHVHGALAFEARAAWTGPERDDRRLAALYRLARGLRREGDLRAATPLLEEVATLARGLSPRLADRALEDLADDAYDRAKRRALEALAGRMENRRANLPLRLETTGRVGLLCLATGDVRGARRALAKARTLYREATEQSDRGQRAGPTNRRPPPDRRARLRERDAYRCTKLWLDFELRRRLAEREGRAGAEGRPAAPKSR